MAKRLNINTAPLSDLMKLPGIGNTLAQRIIAYRERHGPFTGKRELIDVPGLSERMLAPLIDRISLGGIGIPGKTGQSDMESPKPRSASVPAETDPVVQSSLKGGSDTTVLPDNDGTAVTSETAKSEEILTKKEIKKLSRKTKVPKKVLLALFTYFKGNQAFLSNGKPVIEFDGRAFWAQLKSRGIKAKALAKKHPRVLYKKERAKYPSSGNQEYLRLSEAKHINENCAISATAFGMFRLKGMHFKSAGYKNRTDFEKGQAESRGQQLSDFLNVIFSKKMRKALKKKDWNKFAVLYFGPGAKRRKKAKRLKRMYKSIK